MRTYGQYCPVSRASEILAERWTPLVVRNLVVGCTTFNDIAMGVPGMSRSLLARRLRSLEDAGVLTSRPREGRRGKRYELTEAGRALGEVIGALAKWGEMWVALQPEHTDPTFVLWAWVHVHLDRDRLPERRVVVQFDFPDQSPPHHRMWIVVHAKEAELCHARPKHAVDLEVTARSQAFVDWHLGATSWSAAVRAGDIRVDGPRALGRALPTWNTRALATDRRAT